MTRRASGCIVAALLAFVAVFAMAPADASAQYRDPSDDVRLEQEFDENEFMVLGRFRTVGIPNFLLNIGFDRHAANWSGGKTNFAYGAEFVWRKVGAFELSVAAEYANLDMPADFWLESNKPRQEADWVQFDLSVASLVFSGYYYWDVTDWFAPFVGGGLGLGITFNDVVKYSPAQGSSCRNNLGQPGGGFSGQPCFQGGMTGSGDIDRSQFDAAEVEDRIWPVIPMVNVTGGARFNIRHHGVIKLEVGFYDYLFAGLSGGVQW